MRLAGARVDQVLPNLSVGDAASDACLAFGRMLSAAGADTVVWAHDVEGALRGRAQRFEEGALRKRAPRLVILHYATGSAVANRLRGTGVPYGVYFHNVTPPRYFLGSNDLLAGLVWRGLADLAPVVRDARVLMAASAFSARQLEAAGGRCAEVVPLPFEPEEHDLEPDPAVIARLADGAANLLFVGRIAPNKRQDELLRTFYYYARGIDASARLCLVGSAAAAPAYREWLLRAAAEWGLSNRVELAGHVSAAARAAYYRAARVFVSASEHEGFGLPMIEAMHHGVPVVAREAAAVGETVGAGGLLVSNWESRAAAELVAMAAEEGPLRNGLITAGRERVAAFAPGRVAERLVSCVAAAG